MLGITLNIRIVLVLVLFDIARATIASNRTHPWEKYLSPYIEVERNQKYPQLRLRSANMGPDAHYGRNALVFNHNPKAAGTFVTQLFENTLSKLPGKEFRVETERQSVGQSVGFTIGAVREPCDHLVSLWAFGSQGKGGFRKRMVRYLGQRETEPLYGIMAPFNTSEDVLRFRKWVRHQGVQGMMTAMFAHSYSNISDVDCFIIADSNIEEEATRCLNSFILQADDLVTINNTMQESSASLNQNSGSHASCDTYFDEKTAREVEQNEWPLYDAFGWAACCSTLPFRKKPPTSLDHSVLYTESKK
jgi:hypothetical protein